MSRSVGVSTGTDVTRIATRTRRRAVLGAGALAILAAGAVGIGVAARDEKPSAQVTLDGGVAPSSGSTGTSESVSDAGGTPGTSEGTGEAPPIGGQSAEVTTTAAPAPTEPPSTVPPTTVPPPSVPCPNADGSSPRVATFTAPPPLCITPTAQYTAIVETTKGNFTIRLDAAKAPNTVNNFVYLARYHFYDGLTFHRVVPRFIIQGGDPEATGRGGPGYTFGDELPGPGEYKVGSVAMANAKPNDNGSQFFVIVGRLGTGIQPNYSLFGRVVKGLDVLTKIEAVGVTPADGQPELPPKVKVIIERITIKSLGEVAPTTTGSPAAPTTAPAAVAPAPAAPSTAAADPAPPTTSAP